MQHMWLVEVSVAILYHYPVTVIPRSARKAIVCKCTRCSPLMRSSHTWYSLARREAREEMFGRHIEFRLPYRRLLISTHSSRDCSGPVRWREVRQLTAAGQSLTLTPECQPQTRPAPDSRPPTAGQLDKPHRTAGHQQRDSQHRALIMTFRVPMIISPTVTV